MNYYCTHSDKNYLAKGIALYYSIKTKGGPFTLFYLCTDNETLDKLLELNLENIVPISLQELLMFDENLAAAQNNKASNYGTAYSQFCWTLTPYFVWWLVQHKIPENEALLYCDADIWFLNTPQAIFDACKPYSVGIHSHLFESYDSETNDVGEFNVGCVYFKNDKIGQDVAKWWKNCLLDQNNPYAQKYGTCGDQKYLDLFIPLFGNSGNICIFDRNTNPVIYHAAPWNFTRYKFLEGLVFFINNNVTNKIQFTFLHFSHFKTDFNGNWSSSDHGEWKPETEAPQIEQFYKIYNTKVTEANKLING